MSVSVSFVLAQKLGIFKLRVRNADLPIDVSWEYLGMSVVEHASCFNLGCAVRL